MKTTCLTWYRKEHTVVYEGLCLSLSYPAHSVANPQIILVRVISLRRPGEDAFGGWGVSLLWYRE